MFQVRDLGGVNRVYTPGEIRMRRGIEPVAVAQSLLALSAEEKSSAGTNMVQSRYRDPQPASEHQELKFAREIMSSPVSYISPRSSIKEVNEIFTTKRYRHLPVVSAEHNLVGLISDRDILKFDVAVHIERKDPSQVEVSAIMITGILTATPDTLVRDLARTMFEERIGSLPIIDQGLGLVGIVTRSDILRALLKYGPIRLWA